MGEWRGKTSIIGKCGERDRERERERERESEVL